MKLFKLGNLVEFYIDHQGTKVIVLKAICKDANDLPRLYSLAREMLSELTWLGVRNQYMNYCTLVNNELVDVKVIKWDYLDNKDLVLVSFLTNKCQFIVKYVDLLIKQGNK